MDENSSAPLVAHVLGRGGGRMYLLTSPWVLDKWMASLIVK